jgi:diaminopimelate decarboxylase
LQDDRVDGHHPSSKPGILLTRVLYVKTGDTKTFVVVDAGMNDLIRPTLYEAWHTIVPVKETADRPEAVVDVVGPVCETGDIFAANRTLALPQAGDLLAIRSAGAYGAVMASSYNSRPLLPEIMVHGNDFAVVRPRQTLAELMGQDRLPDWLA